MRGYGQQFASKEAQAFADRIDALCPDRDVRVKDVSLVHYTDGDVGGGGYSNEFEVFVHGITADEIVAPKDVESFLGRLERRLAERKRLEALPE